MLTKLLTFYALCVSKRPGIVLAIVFIFVGLSTLYLPNFRLDASSDSLVLENIHTNELCNWLEYVKNDI